jgi:outer membrane protein OmpA-like peptidoglycan-associated protein/outer membrane protein assembly factor BamB
MTMKKLFALPAIIAISAALSISAAFAQDWPIYKGNIYFTGNNDELIVKNANLKWLFQADDRTFNPITSDGRVYFLDNKADLYCLDEEYGRLLWKVDFQTISAQFKAFSKSAGKVKYPLIKGNTLFLSDPIAIYALDKRTGKVLWARTGMRIEDLPKAAEGLSGRKPLPMVDSIYGDPVIQEDNIYYGTRNMFLAREIRNGHNGWENRDIKTYSAYPTFYDNTIITQSSDFGKNTFSVYCLDAQTGKQIWEKIIEKPQRIFPPVVYNRKVYVPANTSLHCLDYKTGEQLWVKDYGRYITSNPSFTDRAIIFSLDNSAMAVVDPENGSIMKNVDVGDKSSPYYVTIRDILYLAYNEKKTINNKELTYGVVRAVNFTDNSTVWEYRTPFPGPVSQPMASNGILYLPCGNYVYAIGTEYYAKIVHGGEGYAVVDNKTDTNAKKPDDDAKRKLDDRISKLDPNKNKNDGLDDQFDNRKKPDNTSKPDNNAKDDTQIKPQPEKEKKLAMKKLTVKVGDSDGKPIPAQVEVRKWENGRLVYNDTRAIRGQENIDIPAGEGVEITASSSGYLPKKEILTGNEDDKEIRLDKIEKNKTFVIDNINFEFNKAYLKKESMNLVERVLRIMKENQKLKLEVRGHTDNIGDPAYNQKLSERRADAVAEYLIKNGISPERIKSKGLGETKPLVPNTSEKNRAKNRRTEFTFVD